MRTIERVRNFRPSLRDLGKDFEWLVSTVETVGYSRSSLTGLHGAFSDYFEKGRSVSLFKRRAIWRGTRAGSD